MVTLIESLGVALMDAGVTGVHLIEAPPEPSPAVVLRPYAATADPELPIGRQSIQCMVRAKSLPESEALAWKCYKALLEAVPAADRRVFSITPRQEPFFLDRDDKRRYLHVFNFDVRVGHKEV